MITTALTIIIVGLMIVVLYLYSILTSVSLYSNDLEEENEKLLIENINLIAEMHKMKNKI